MDGPFGLAKVDSKHIFLRYRSNRVAIDFPRHESLFSASVSIALNDARVRLTRSHIWSMMRASAIFDFVNDLV